MTARFWAEPSKALPTDAANVIDRKTSKIVAYCNDMHWAEMIADGLNVIVDQVAPWSPGAAYNAIVDGEIVEGGVTSRREIES